MGSSFQGMNIVVLLFLCLIIPTFSISDHVETITKSTTTRDFSSQPLDSAPSSINGFGIFGKCPKLLTEEMVDKVLDHLTIPENIKSILRKSAKFGVCIADNFCKCVMLKFEPLIIGCFVEIGFKCMKDIIPDRVYNCTTACEKSITKANHRLSDEAIGDFCYSKCTKRVILV